MRVIQTAYKHAVGMEWSELAGPFPTLFAAEQWVDNPPSDLGDPGTVTIDRKDETGYWFVFCLESTTSAQREAA